jgi:hypothetical protein
MRVARRPSCLRLVHLVARGLPAHDAHAPRGHAGAAGNEAAGHGGHGFGSATDLWHLPREKLTSAITWNDDLIDSTDGNFRSALLRAAPAGVSQNAKLDSRLPPSAAASAAVRKSGQRTARSDRRRAPHLRGHRELHPRNRGAPNDQRSVTRGQATLLHVTKGGRELLPGSTCSAGRVLLLPPSSSARRRPHRVVALLRFAQSASRMGVLNVAEQRSRAYAGLGCRGAAWRSCVSSKAKRGADRRRTRPDR